MKKEKTEFRTAAEKLVSQMTVDEKISQLRHAAPAVGRLGIPEYNYWNECLHGVARAGEATVFPQCMAMAATFDAPLVRSEAGAIADEGRAKFNEFRKAAPAARFHCLTYCTPNINIFRDPRWGRGQETFGEDPYLTSVMGAEFVKGLQGDGKFHKTDAELKHFAVHSGPESERHSFDARPPLRDLYGTYLRAFRYCIEKADAGIVMCAYNRFFGEACAASERLIGKILREEMGFDGLVVSDYLALDDLHGGHKLTSDPAESAALALNSGLQLEYGETWKHLREAYDRGLVTEEKITEAAVSVFETRFRLGLFEKTPFDDIPYSVVCCREHRELNLRAARESVVLLENDGILPLKNVKNLAVIGPNGDSMMSLLGNYNGTPLRPVTPKAGICRACDEAGIGFRYSAGCDFRKPQPDSDGITTKLLTEAVVAAATSDAVILCVGLNPDMEGEEGVASDSGVRGDKNSLELPAVQRELLAAIAATGKPIITVNMSGSCVSLSEFAKSSRAVIQMFYPGECGGTALADVLFGRQNPCGRLPVTFYKSTGDLPDIRDYSMEGRTYRFFTGEPEYPFGYGKSYTEFAYSDAAAERDGDAVVISANVTNTGKYPGREVAQCYVRLPYGNPELAGFVKTELAPGECRRVSVTVPVSGTGWYGDDGAFHPISGETVFFIGGHQPDPVSARLTGYDCLSVGIEADN
mgnify:FL=1